MKLPFLSFKSPASQENYFGLFLKEGKGVGYIFGGDGTRLRVLGRQEFKYSNSWENLTEDVDEVLFKLENETKCRIEKTIFFLFSHLIDEASKEIKRPYLQKIKELTRNLEIKPIGYIECYEAVASFLQQRENAPLTAILVELDDTNVDVFIYKGGHRVNSYIVARTDNIIDDLHTVFDTVGKNTLLPNRLILYNSSSLVEESTKIISHRWSPDLFVQLPRVEILKEEDILNGLQSVFEEQIYREDKAPEAAPKQEPKEVMGFVVGRDVRDEEPRTETRSGFTVQHSASPARGRKPGEFFAKLKLPHFRMPGVNPLRAVAVVAVVAVVFGLFAGFEFLFHKASVTAVFSSSQIDKKIDADAVINGDPGEGIIVHVATSSMQMQDVKITTGKRDIGDEARGEVTLYNFDDKEKSFDKGTTIQADNLAFTMDDSAKVPASTLANDASAKLPGKAKVKVTASQIGPEYNLDKGKRFRIADLSSSVYFAMNDTGFSGGTKKTVKTVAKKDIDELQNSILEKATKELKGNIAKSVDSHSTLIDSLTDFELSNVKYSKELGEEGENLTLKANVVATYYYFDNSNVASLLKKEALKDIPQGYGVDDANFSYQVENVKKDGNSLAFTLRLKAKATKKLDETAVRRLLRFRQASTVADFMKSDYGALSATADVTPQIPLVGSLLPFFENNILLRVESQ